MLNLTAPVRVAVIDVARPLTDIDCGRAELPPYTAAWILVCKAGRPLGSIEIPLRDPVIAVAELEREVSGRLGRRLAAGRAGGSPAAAAAALAGERRRPHQLRAPG